MRRSEKILLAILVLGLLAWQGSRLIDRQLLEPIRRRHAELDRLDQQLAAQQEQTVALSRDQASLRRWRQRSLPPDPLTAQRLYQHWLTDLAQDCGFAALRVFPDRVTSKNDQCLGVQVSIDAEATLAQLVRFLDRFYRIDLAQQITMLNIDSSQNQGDPMLRVTIMAEGLSLRDAPPRRRLFPAGTLGRDIDQDETIVPIDGGEAWPKEAGFLVRAGGEYMRVVAVAGTQWTVKRGADQSSPRSHSQDELVELVPVVDGPEGTPRTDVMRLVENNPFAKPTPKTVTPSIVVAAATPEIDPAEFTYLVAAFAQGRQRQAWFYDRLNNQNVVITPGLPFSVAGIDAVVQTIGDDFILLDHADARWRLQLGNNLRALERLPASTDEAQEVP